MSEINQSGLKPLGVAVLLEEFKPERKVGKIVIPESALGRQSMIDNRARVIDVGPSAWHDEPSPRAKPGDVVLVTQFAGFLASGADGKQYRLVNDRDVFCGLNAEAFEKKALEEAA